MSREEKALAAEAAAFKRAGWVSLEELSVTERHKRRNEQLTQRHIEIPARADWLPCWRKVFTH